MNFIDDEAHDIRMHYSPVPGAATNIRLATAERLTNTEVTLPLVLVWPGCGKARRVMAEVVDGQAVRRYVTGPTKKPADRRYLKHDNYPGLFRDAPQGEEAEILAKQAAMHQLVQSVKHPLCNDAMHLKQFMAGMSDALCFRRRNYANELQLVTWRLNLAYEMGWDAGQAELQRTGTADQRPTKRATRRY